MMMFQQILFQNLSNDIWQLHSCRQFSPGQLCCAGAGSNLLHFLCLRQGHTSSYDFLMLPMTLFEVELDLGFEPFAVIPSSTSIYYNFNENNMTLAYSHKINPYAFLFFPG